MTDWISTASDSDSWSPAPNPNVGQSGHILLQASHKQTQSELKNRTVNKSLISAAVDTVDHWTLRRLRCCEGIFAQS